jgi:4-aminobutyrate aminotransferase-like enzyme
VRGEGVWIFDPDGRRYLDAYNNVPVAGHGHPDVVRAVAGQLRRLNTHTRYTHEAVVELAERLLATMPGHFDRVLFVNSGSEANDVAWRVARFVTGGSGAIVTRHAYHGVTEAATNLSPEGWPSEYAPANVGLVPAPDGYRGEHRRAEADWEERYAAHVAAAAEDLAARGLPLAAMFVDSSFTSDGVLGPTHGYVRAAARAVAAAGGLFVADEVQSGFGRTGEHLWSFSGSGVEPDMVTLGKPMGNGFPVAAVVTRSELVDEFAERTGYFSTFGGNPVACVAGLAVLRAVDEEGLVANAAAVGSYLRERLRGLMDAYPGVGDVRGWGLLTGVELVRDREGLEPAPDLARAVANGLRHRGILIGTTGAADNVLKIRPPLVFRAEHADLLVSTLDQVLEGLGG